MNGIITPTKFTEIGVIETVVNVGQQAYIETINTSIMKKSLLDELESAITKLEGYATKVKNCDCVQIYTCQTMTCQIMSKGTSNCNWQTCQSAKNCTDIMGCQKLSCQYMTCQKTVCQQGVSCQACQSCERQVCETCESQCLCQTCQSCQEETYEVWSCQIIKCQKCQSCQNSICENVSCQAYTTDGRDLS